MAQVHMQNPAEWMTRIYAWCWELDGREETKCNTSQNLPPYTLSSDLDFYLAHFLSDFLFPMAYVSAHV